MCRQALSRTQSSLSPKSNRWWARWLGARRGATRARRPSLQSDHCLCSRPQRSGTFTRSREKWEMPRPGSLVSLEGKQTYISRPPRRSLSYKNSSRTSSTKRLRPLQTSSKSARSWTVCTIKTRSLSFPTHHPRKRSNSQQPLCLKWLTKVQCTQQNSQGAQSQENLIWQWRMRTSPQL